MVMKKPLLLIPARAGSKRLPGKNMQMIGPRTLLGWAIRQAKYSMLGPVVVSSDDDGIIDHALRVGADESLRRPAELALDDTPMIKVVRHALKWAVSCDGVILLQPTSPLRQPEDIVEAIDTIDGGDAVVSVMEIKHPEVFTVGHASRLRAAPTPDEPLYVANGAIFILTRDAIEAGHDWFDAPISYAYVMPQARSLDIDVQEELDQARRMMGW